MRKRVLSLALAMLLALAVAVPAMADEQTPSVTVSTLIGARYEDAGVFTDGLAPVKSNGKWGCIDEMGRVVVPFNYTFIHNFSDNVAVAVTESASENYIRYKYWLLKKDGSRVPLTYFEEYEAVTQQYEKVWYPEDGSYDFKNEAAYAYDGVMAFDGRAFNTNTGKAIEINKSDLDALFKRAKQCFGSNESPDFYFVTANGNPCVDGIIPMCIESSDVWACVLVNKDGHIVKDYIDKINMVKNSDGWGYDKLEVLDRLTAPKDGLVVAAMYDVLYDTYKFGAFDYATGDWVIKPTYSGFRYYLSGTFFSNGLWIVQNEAGLYGAVDKKGNAVIPLKYDFLNVFNQGLAAASKDGEWFYIDTFGNRYDVGLPGGGVVTDIAVANSFSDLGVALVYDRGTDEAYLVMDTPVNGVLPAIKGSEGVSISTYFPNYDGTIESLSTTNNVDEIVAFEDNGKYGFYKLDFDLEGANPYDDVLPGAWYYEPIMWSVRENITEPASETEYDVISSSPRSDIIISLWRAAGMQEPTLTENPFNDLKETDECYKAALWAYENKITTGTGGGNFSPDMLVSREQIVTFLWRADGETPVTSGETFSDVKADDYFAEAVRWAVKEKIAEGTGGGLFSPKKNCTRGELVTFLYRQFAED